MQLNILEQSETFDKTLLADAKDSVSKAMTDLRDIAKSLNSERIHLSGLTEIITHELSRISRSGLMLTNLHIEGREQPIHDQKKLILFRIIQETLQNVLKHSKAKNVDLNFYYEQDCLKIQVTDNGKGFDKNVSTKKEGLGLQNIINRAALLGGEAHINSKINEGTTITIITPYV